jgi:C4-dicarboxylate-specific signal transduction histidine kinase
VPAAYRLLVVDDEPLALNLVKRVFEHESDIELHSATSPQRGLEIAMLHDMDLVITDQRMPEMEGLQFLARIREVRPRALRILLTAFPDTAVALKAINEGLVYRFVLKPWDTEDMRVTVRRALETKRLSDEHERLVVQLKTSHQELVDAEHMAALGRLAVSIGHELNKAVVPLLASVGSLETELGRLLDAGRSAHRALQHDFAEDDVKLLKNDLLRASPELAGSAEESLGAVRAAASQLESLVHGIESYAHQDKPEPIDINQAVLSAVQLLSHRFREAGKLERDLRAVPLVRGRASEITQVMLNLIGNAADAVQAVLNPTVHVRTWHEGRHVKIEVSDNGTGLDPAIAARLFQPFASTKAPGRRGGLGLSICRGIVESHGGSIEAVSPKGRGTLFTVTLPAIESGV